MCSRPQQLRVTRLSSEGGCVVLDIVTPGYDEGWIWEVTECEGRRRYWLDMFCTTMRRN